MIYYHGKIKNIMNIVQIGVCNGNDDLTKIIDNNQPNKLILIEPLNLHNNEILNCYNWVTNIFLENVVIVPQKNDNKIIFYYHIEDIPNYELSSIDKYHILKHERIQDKINGIREIEINTMTINELFEKYELKNIDILFIDAEGSDNDILKSVDFEKYNIDIIYFENLHIKEYDIFIYLENKGYIIDRYTLNNGWSSSAKKIDKL